MLRKRTNIGYRFLILRKKKLYPSLYKGKKIFIEVNLSMYYLPLIVALDTNVIIRFLKSLEAFLKILSRLSYWRCQTRLVLFITRLLTSFLTLILLLTNHLILKWQGNFTGIKKVRKLILPI